MFRLIFKFVCKTDSGLRWGQWMFDTGRAKNLRHSIFKALAGNVGWQESRKYWFDHMLVAAAHELDPGLPPYLFWIAN